MWVRTFALKAYTAAVIRGIAAIHAPAAIRSVMMKVVETVGFLTLIAFKSKTFSVTSEGPLRFNSGIYVCEDSWLKERK